jgi:DNA invertase Pin-like site-specific DNA recombinase
MTMVAAFAQYFSDNLSGHTRKGMRERTRQGLFNGDPPFGYQRCDPECLGLDESHTG